MAAAQRKKLLEVSVFVPTARLFQKTKKSVCKNLEKEQPPDPAAGGKKFLVTNQS